MIYRKKTLLVYMLPLLVACTFTLLSCTRDNHGYPKNVFIPAEGGSVTIDGESWISYVEFLDGDTFVTAENKFYDEETEIEYFNYKWLKIESPRFKHSITITAEPNQDSRQRSISFEPTFTETYNYGLIKVTQGAR